MMFLENIFKSNCEVANKRMNSCIDYLNNLTTYGIILRVTPSHDAKMKNKILSNNLFCFYKEANFITSSAEISWELQRNVLA